MAVKGKGKQVVTEDAPRNSGGSGSGSKRRKSGSGADAGPSSSSKRSRVQQFLDDVAGVDDDYEEEEEEEPESDDDDWGDGFVTEKIENANFKRTERSHPPPFKRAERSHPLPFLGHVKEEELSGDELEEFINKRYSSGVRYAGYGGSTQDYDDEDTMDGADGALKEPTIWRVKCMVGRERHTAFCFMQKFVDLQKFGTKVPIISAFSLDNVRGFVFVEAEKACDVTEVCKGFCNVYASRTSFVPAAEVPSLLSSRAKPFEVAPGTWVRMKSGNYKGDLAQVIGADDARKRVMIKPFALPEEFTRGKQGVVKHLYMGILFIYNESETENNGFFCAQCGSCENIKKRRELASSEENPIPMFSESPFLSSEQNEQRDNGRSYTSTREQLFSIGQMLRIKKGPLKGYLCRVVRIFRNDVTVKLDSLLKIVSVQAEFLSVPTRRGDNSSGAPSGPSGSQDTPFFGSEADNSWDNGLTSLGSDTWQPFSSSTLPAQNAGGESEVDPWCKKTAPSADGDSDPWCNKTSSAVDVWNNSTTQKESSNDNAWDKQAGGGGLDSGGSSWGVAAANKENEKSDDWGEACKVADLATGDDSDPWGSKVKEVDVREADTWGKTSVPPEKKLEDDSQGWGLPSKSSQDQEKCTYSKDANRAESWDAAIGGTSVSRVGDDDSWVKCDLPPVAQDDAWGKSKEINNGSGNWNKANDWDKPKFGGGAGPSSWNKGEAVEEDNLNNSWSKPGGSFEGGRGFGRGRGRGRGRESGDSGGRNDQGSWKNSWGNGNSGGSSWSSDVLVDNETGNGGGFRGRGRGRDNGWRNGDQSGSEFGRERSSGGTPNVGNSQPWNGGEGTKSCDENQTSTWNSSEDKKLSGGEQNDSWASKTTKGQERQTDAWSTKVTSTAEAENNSDPWNTKAKDTSCSAGGKLENGASGEERGADPWANKIDSDKDKEHEIDPWASKVSSTMGAYNSNDGWNTKADEKGDPWNNKGGDEKGGGWSKAGSSGGHQGSSWGKPSSSSGYQEPAWSKRKYGDDNAGYDRGGFGRGNRGRGRFGDGGSSWNGGSNRNDESGGGRFGDGGRGRGRLGDGGSSWNGGSNRNDESGGRLGDGGRGRGRFGDGGSSWNGGSNRNDESGGGRFGDGGRGCFVRGDRGQDNNFGPGDRGGGGSWGSGRGNSDQGGGWSQSSSWNADKNGSTEGKQAFSKGNSSWGSEKNDDWGAPKPSGGDDQAGKNDGNNGWSQNKSSGSSVLGQWNAPGETTTGGSSSILGAPPSSTTTGGGGSWGKNNEDGWNSPKGVGGSEGGSKKEVSWEKSEGSESQGGGGSSWDKADGGWNSKKDGNSGSGW